MNLARAKLQPCTSIVIVGRERARQGWHKAVPCAMEVLESAQDRSLAGAVVIRATKLISLGNKLKRSL